MALPGETLSSSPLPEAWAETPKPRNMPLFDYELGGIALNDSSQGLEVQEWTIELDGEDVVVSAPQAEPTVLFSQANIRELALSFDQNMRPFVAYTHGTGDDPTQWTATYRWYDTQAQQQTFTDLAAGTVSPRCTLDDKRRISTQSGDIILAYVRDGNLYYRQQRDRYQDEVMLKEGGLSRLLNIGMGTNYRLHFSLIEDD